VAAAVVGNTDNHKKGLIMHLANKVLIVSALLSSSAFADPLTRNIADGFSASVGADYSTGNYGTNESTKVFYMPFAATYETGAFTYKLTIPYIRVTGIGEIVPGGLGGAGSGSSGGVGTFGCAGDNRRGASKPEDNGPCAVTSTTTTTTSTARRVRSTESGLGDIVAALTYNVLDDEATGFVVDVTGRIKFGTASESKGLGSGKTDYAAQVNVDKYFGAPYLSAGLGYKVLGEPRGVNYDNVVYGSLGGGYKFSNVTSMGFSYDWATAAVDGATRPQEVSVYASHRINNNYKLNGFIYTGLSNASPDVGAGATLSYYF
jgi:hypothetical protein